MSGPVCFLCGDCGQPLFAIVNRAAGEIDQREIEGELFGDPLHKVAVMEVESRPQDFMPIDDRLEGAPECVHIKRAKETEQPRNMIRRSIRIELMRQPKPLLVKRSRRHNHPSTPSRSGTSCQVCGI